MRLFRENREARTIREIHDAFDRKRFSPSELTKELLGEIRASQLNAFITVCEDRAVSQALLADEALDREGKVPRERMPLFGIPFGIKDALTLDGVRTTCASKILERYIPPYTATSVERLEMAGAITLGKLNMDEFAMGGSNENSAFGPVLHPTHPDRVPGGSSGGSAAAVRAGLCVASLGSDTGGSIRLPASFCGVVGVKPTYGRVSRSGLVAFASSLDQVGPFASTVEDAARILDVLSGHDPMDPTSAQMAPTRAAQAIERPVDWKNLRVGVPKEFLSGYLAPDVTRATEESLRLLESLGARRKEISLPHAKYSVEVYYLVAVSEASSNLARYDGVRFGSRPEGAEAGGGLAGFYKKVRAGFGPEVKRRILLGTFALSAGYSEAYYRRACQVRRLVQRDFEQAFQEVDVIVGPVSPGTAFKLGEKVRDPLQMYLNDIFTIPANLAGLPALSVPCGEDAEGLSIGLQIMGPTFSDEKILAVAHGLFTQARGGF